MTTPDASPKPEQVDLSERAPEPVADNPNPVIVADAPALVPAADAGAAEQREPPPDPRTAKMKEIADRVRAKRTGEKAPVFTGDFTDPTQTYGGFAQQPDAPEPAAAAAAEPAPEPEPEPAPSPKRFKLKVDGQEFERDLSEVARLADMTAEEIEANPERATRYAQKELAASRRLDQAKDILRGAHQRQDDRSRAPEPSLEPAPEPSPAAPDQDRDEFATLIEEIQFGADPKESAKKLRAAITQAAGTASKQTVTQQRITDDLAAANATVARFKSANKDLADDPIAEAAMTTLLYTGFKEDLVALGVPEDQIPNNRDALADAHRIARLHNHPVRSVDKLLDDTRSRYLDWRGTPGQRQPPTPSPAPRPSRPQVVVNRDDRRQAIPTQPTRASVPQNDPANVKPQPRTRSQTIMEMKKARGQATA